MKDSEKLIHIVYGIDNARDVSESDCLVLFNTPLIYGVYDNSMTAFSDLVELEDSESYGHLTWYCETQKIRTESQGKVIQNYKIDVLKGVDDAHIYTNNDRGLR